MHTALRYTLFGALVASIVSLWSPAWWVTLIAFWAGSVMGLVIGFLIQFVDSIIGKYLPD